MLLGDMCDGEILEIDYLNETVAACGNGIKNTAPVLDFKVCSRSSIGSSGTETRQIGGDLMYMTSGCVPNGQIRRLEMGVDVVVEAGAGDEEEEGASVESGSDSGFEGITGLWSLKQSHENKHDSFLGVSLLTETRLFHLLDDTLEDVSQQSGLNLQVPTLLMAGVGGSDMEDALVVQVWEGGVLVTRPSYFEEQVVPVMWTVDGQEVVGGGDSGGGKIALAAMCGEFLFLSLGAWKVVLLLRVSVAQFGSELASIVQVSRIVLEHEPSYLFATTIPKNGRNAIVCVTGTYEPSVVVLEVDEMQNLALNSCLPLPSAYQSDIHIPNSLQVLNYGEDLYLFIGLRDGTLVLCNIITNSTTESVSFAPFDTIKVGHQPVSMIPTSTTNRPNMLILSNKLWNVSIKKTNTSSNIALNHASVADVHPVCFENLTVGTTFSHSPPLGATVTDSFTTTFIFATPKSLSFVSLNSTGTAQSTTPNIKSLSINKTPRRVIYDSITRTLIVACNTRVSGKDVLTGEIKLMDPRTGVQYLREVLPKGEACYSMTVWNIKDQKRYICIGTWGYRETPTAVAQGRVLVYSLKETETKSFNKPPFKIRKLGEYAFPEMVFAVCSFMKSYLLAASGNCLYQLKIEATSRTLHCGAKTELGYAIRSLSVSGSHIFVGGANDSISLYSFDARTKQFTFCRSDSLTRSPSDCLSLSSTQVLVADKSGQIFCLESPKTATTSRFGGDYQQPLCFKTAFCINMGEMIMRLHVGQMDTGFDGAYLGLQSLVQEDEDNNSINELHGKTRVATRLQVVYGCSIVGSVFAFRGIKDPSVYERLKRIQDVLAVYPATRPLLGNDYLKFRSTGSHGMQNVVDGELLKRWIVLSGTEKRQVLDESGGVGFELEDGGGDGGLCWFERVVDCLFSLG
ncbi:UNVERIFIED_CONTAM: hypothetical protein HDU68_012931 [Siphonaria sp. JEL0065]|nr:hypothetical protein HDU68_012931 [Siphonaria sp. JEL0065]